MFTLLEVDSGAGNSNDTKATIPNVAVEITRGSRPSLEWDNMCTIYMISLSKFKLEEQLCFTAKLNIMYMHIFQAALNVIVKYIEENKLNQ